MSHRRPPHLLFVALTVLLLGTFCLNLATGSVQIPLDEIIAILLGAQPTKATWIGIIFKFRLPKAITASLAGAALAVSGLQMQTLFANPLAGPFVLGINAGASLGVAIAVLALDTVGTSGLFGSLGAIANLGLVLAASLGAALTLGLVILIAQQIRNSMTLLLLGLMLGYATNAIVTILLHFSSSDRIQSYLTWTFGSFSSVTWNQMQIFAPTVVLGVGIAHFLGKILNLMLLGEMQAIALGLSVQLARFWAIASASVLAGSVTAFCGPIAFLGVAVPHLCRAVFQTTDCRILLPATTLVGAILALLADLVAQLPGSQVVLPLNAVTALIGAPVVTWVILKQQRPRGW